METKSFTSAPPQNSPGGEGVLPYLTLQDLPLNRVSFNGKNYAAGCPFRTKIMRQGIPIDKKNATGHRVKGNFLEFFCNNGP